MVGNVESKGPVCETGKAYLSRTEDTTGAVRTPSPKGEGAVVTRDKRLG